MFFYQSIELVIEYSEIPSHLGDLYRAYFIYLPTSLFELLIESGDANKDFIICRGDIISILSKHEFEVKTCYKIQSSVHFILQKSINLPIDSLSYLSDEDKKYYLQTSYNDTYSILGTYLKVCEETQSLLNKTKEPTKTEKPKAQTNSGSSFRKIMASRGYQPSQNKNSGPIVSQDTSINQCDICLKQIKGENKFVVMIGNKKYKMCESCLAYKKKLGDEVDIISSTLVK